MGGETGIVEPVSRGRFGEGPIAVVDEEQVRALCRRRALEPGDRDVDVEEAVVVDVHHADARGPSFGSDPGALGDVLEAHLTLVQVESARDHVAGEVEIRQPVVVDVAHTDAGTVVQVDVGLHVHRVRRGDRIGEGDAGLVGAEELEQGAFGCAVGACC